MHPIRVAHAVDRQPSLPDTATDTATDTEVVHHNRILDVERSLDPTRLRT
jgi:hypothetical protein